MDRRRERESPISLLFFQDIITCVSGVMILLMLLFAISVPKEASSTTDYSADTEEPQDISQEIQQLRERLATLRGMESAYAHAREMKRLKTRTRSAEKDLARSSAETAKILKALAAIERSVQQSEQRLAQAERALDAAKKVRKVRFIPQGRTRKTAILVECSKKTMLCGIAGQSLEPVEFAWEPLKPFAEHVKRFDPDSHLFVFLLKPSAPPVALGVVRIVQLSGFEVGFDALEEENLVDYSGGR